MARKEIGNPLDRQNRNNHNDNYKELYDEIGVVDKRIDGVVDEISDQAFDKVIDNSKLNWKEPVNNFNSLPSNAQKGDTRMDRSTGKVYRYDGTKWTEIQQIDAGPVNEVDARLTSQLNEKVSESNGVVTANDRPVKTLFAVIRNTGETTWTFIEDSTHEKLNFSPLEVTGDDLKLNYDFTANKVGSLLITPDETMAHRGVTAGASVGTSHANIMFYSDVELAVKGDGAISFIKPELKNIVTVSKRADGTGVDIVHPIVGNGNNDIPSVSQMADLGTTRSDSLRVAWTENRVSVQHFKDFSGTISYNATSKSWEVRTDNVNKPTVSFDTNTGRLTVTHAKDITPITSYGGVLINEFVVNDIRARLIGLGNSNMIIEFRDAEGNILLTPSTDMRFSYFRNIKVPTLMDDSTRFIVKRGKVKVPASDLVTGSSGNYWIQGLMNV